MSDELRERARKLFRAGWWRPMTKTPVDIPYIVSVRRRSRFAQRYGAKAWYEYPKLAKRVGEKAKALRDFTALIVGNEAAHQVPLALYRRVFATALQSRDQDES